MKPFAANLSGIKEALKELLELNLTPKTRTEVNGAITYVSSFRCILMSSIWFKTLAPIDTCNKIIQARNATVDMEVSNSEILIKNLQNLRSDFKRILSEAKEVANNLGIEIKFERQRKKKRFFDESKFDEENLSEIGQNTEEEVHFNNYVFNVIIDSVIGGLKNKFEATKQISSKFSFLWKYLSTTEEGLIEKSNFLADIYTKDINGDDLGIEMVDLKKLIHPGNFGEKQLNPFELPNKILTYKLENIVPNICVSLRIFLTIPATVASAERSFSKLKLINNYLRSTMSQDRVISLARLSIESELAREIDFRDVIKAFAREKARRALLNV